jgi:hypothetical protein
MTNRLFQVLFLSIIVLKMSQNALVREIDAGKFGVERERETEKRERIILTKGRCLQSKHIHS